MLRSDTDASSCGTQQRSRISGQRARPKGARRGKQVRRAHQLPSAPMRPCIIVGHDDVRDSIWSFGRVTQADDWSTHRRSLPREIFKLASTWLIPGATFWNLYATAGSVWEAQNPAQDAQLSWCSYSGTTRPPSSTEFPVLGRTPSGATSTMSTGNNTDTEGCRHCRSSSKMGLGCRSQLS